MLVAICSVKGSPGVTTFSLALAARWPNPHASCVVVEADPAGGDVAARFDQPTTPGLVSLAAASRRDDDPRLVWRHTQALPGGLPVVVAPVGAEQTRAALTALDDADSLHRAGRADKAVVVVDCGRLDPGSPAAAFLHAADHALVMVRAHAADLAHLASRLAAISRRARQVHVLLVGPGHTAGEVARELGVPVLGTVPDDRRGAAALTGSPTPRSFRPARPRLSRSAARIAGTLAAPAEPVPDPASEPITVLGGGLDVATVADRYGRGKRGGRP